MDPETGRELEQGKRNRSHKLHAINQAQTQSTNQAYRAVLYEKFAALQLQKIRYPRLYDCSHSEWEDQILLVLIRLHSYFFISI